MRYFKSIEYANTNVVKFGQGDIGNGLMNPIEIFVHKTSWKVDLNFFPRTIFKTEICTE